MKPIWGKGCMLASEAWLQIEMAAGGCVSGTLKEWPLLQQAFFEFNVKIPEDSSALFIQLVCKDLIKIRDEHKKGEM